jgi:hypothetical protein
MGNGSFKFFMNWFSPQQRTEILLRYTEQKQSLFKIALHFGSSTTSVRQVLVANGIDIRTSKQQNSQR